MNVIQVVMKEFRLVQGLVTVIKIVQPVLELKKNRVAMLNHVKSSVS